MPKALTLSAMYFNYSVIYCLKLISYSHSCISCHLLPPLLCFAYANVHSLFAKKFTAKIRREVFQHLHSWQPRNVMNECYSTLLNFLENFHSIVTWIDRIKFKCKFENFARRMWKGADNKRRLMMIDNGEKGSQKLNEQRAFVWKVCEELEKLKIIWKMLWKCLYDII